MKQRLYSLILLLVLGALMAPLVAACGSTATTPTATAVPAATETPAPTVSPTPTEDNTPEVTTTASPTQAAIETSATTRTVTDSDGTSVEIPAVPKKIASLRSGHTEIICALGGHKMIGAVDGDVQGGKGMGAFITSVYPDLKNLPTADVDLQTNVEELIKIDPDVVITGGKSRIKLIEQLRKQTDLPVVAAHFEEFDKYMDDSRLVARVVNAEARGEELVKYFEDELDSVASKVKDVPEDQKVRVFYGVFDVYHAYGPNNFEDSTITAAGGMNVAADTTGWAPEVSPEQLINWDPQVIVIGHYSSDYSVETILSDPKLADLSAVKNGRVYLLPDPTWEYTSPQALFAVKWLAVKLYPEKFQGLDLLTEANAFYQKVYGVDYSGPALEALKADSKSSEGTGDSTGYTLVIKGLVQQELSFTIDDLKPMAEKISAEFKGETKEYEGVKLQRLLEKAGLQPGAKSLLILASDGYSAEIGLDILDDCPDCMAAFQPNGGVGMVMPALDLGAWVRDVVSIEVQ